MVSITQHTKMLVNAGLAVLAGLALRVFFVLKFPVTDSGDAPFYIELAWNWLKNGVYGFPVNGHLTPVDMRVPGYPAFLAAVFAFAGNSPRAVMLAQVVVDLATCFLIALIAGRLAPETSRRRVMLAGLWLAALCPFTANYTAVVLTETLTIFLTALAILVLLETDFGKKIDRSRRVNFGKGAVESMVPGGNRGRVRDTRAPGNAIGPFCRWLGAGHRVVAASELGETFSYRIAACRRDDIAAGTLGGAQLEHAARRSVFGAAIQRASR